MPGLSSISTNPGVVNQNTSRSGSTLISNGYCGFYHESFRGVRSWTRLSIEPNIISYAADLLRRRLTSGDENCYWSVSEAALEEVNLLVVLGPAGYLVGKTLLAKHRRILETHENCE